MHSSTKRKVIMRTVPVIFLAITFSLILSSQKDSTGKERKQDPRGNNPIAGKVNPFIKKMVAKVKRPESEVSDFLAEGQQIFRFDTFGDEEFWGDELQLHKVIETVTPRQALELGLKVDEEALPSPIIRMIRNGEFDLDDPNNTLLLLKQNAVVGVTGFFNNNGSLKSIGFQCALCHSTVNNSLTSGIGERLDGWANHDLNVGAIIALAPNLNVIANILNTNVDTVKNVLNAWGPGKFDAELILDGKGFAPDGSSAATLIPNAFDQAGFNLHTWTGAWGTVTYWNAFVANIELHGKGTFFDPRMSDSSKFPVAAREGFGNIQTKPEEDLITSKLPALHFYQLAIPAPEPIPGTHFNQDAAERGGELFVGKAECNNCHVVPLFTEPGWNLHEPDEIGIDSFQADRAPDNKYKTMNLEGLFIRELGIFMKEENKGRFFHDGRFETLKDVVEHYNTALNLGLSNQEMNDLVEYLKSL
ncbi:MAG: hypothetical protein E3K32_01450 [wastewater metagenome]|nr:hypothetical protein [Candidatus Loosdrechtia aerotolerans]